MGRRGCHGSAASRVASRGWRQTSPIVTDQALAEALCPDGVPPLVAPRTWFLATGWKRHGLLDPDYTPGVPR